MCEVYHEAIIDRQNAVISPGKTAGCIALLSGIGPSPESKNENRSLLPEKRPIPESKNENRSLLPEKGLISESKNENRSLLPKEFSAGLFTRKAIYWCSIR